MPGQSKVLSLSNSKLLLLPVAGLLWSQPGWEGALKRWNRLPGEVVESPALKMFKQRLDMSLGAVV